MSGGSDPRPLEEPIIGSITGLWPKTLVAFGVLVLALPGCGGEASDSRPSGQLAAPGEGLPQIAEGAGQAVGASPVPSSPPPLLAAPTRHVPMAELGQTVGEASAPLRIIEFSDFGCGYCRQFHLEVYPKLEEEYVATGKVQWKYVPMILGLFGPTAELAARAGECAIEQDDFDQMRDRLFAEQPEWKRASDPLALFEGYARDAGLDVPRWTRCVREDWRRDRITSGTTQAIQSGVRGTPTFFLVGHGTIPGSLPLDLFREVLDGAYADATGP